MRRTYAVALAILLMLGLASCGEGEPRPRISSPTDSGASTSSKSSPNAGGAASTTPESAVTTWLAGYNELLATGDEATVLTASSSRCTTCGFYTEPLVSVYKNGGFVESKGWKLANTKPLSAKPTPRGTSVLVAIRETAGRSKSSSDGEPTSFEEQRFILRFTLAEESSAWKVTRIARLS